MLQWVWGAVKNAHNEKGLFSTSNLEGGHISRPIKEWKGSIFYSPKGASITGGKGGAFPGGSSKNTQTKNDLHMEKVWCRFQGIMLWGSYFGAYYAI